MIKVRPNNGMQRTALRAAADAERWAARLKLLESGQAWVWTPCFSFRPTRGGGRK